uniref:Tail protein n=1 Tax=Ochrobactrum phage ORM_20 TaxID=2985243 RepID=A0A9N6WS93_9VIRU|nr:tail protein [Ochrobactrum phage ORM_20]
MAELSSYEKNRHDPDKPLTFPGEYRLEEATVAGRNFLNKVGSIVIFEDLSLPFVKGELNIIDTENLASVIPLIGGEEIKFTIRDCYNQTLSFTFYLDRVADRRPVSMGAVRYTIRFASKSYILSKARKVSKAYQKMKTEDILKDLLKNYLDHPEDKFHFVTTERPISCIIPNWRPSYGLKWLASRSISSKSEFSESPYLIFEEKNGDMNFVPLDFLYNKETNIVRGDCKVKFGRNSIDNDPSIAFHERMGTHQLSMESFEIVKTSDFGDNLEFGMYNNVVQEVDTFARDTNYFEYKYLDEFKKSQHLNEFPFAHEKNSLEAQDLTSYWQTIPKNDGLFSDMNSEASVNPNVYSFVSKWQQTEQMVVRGVLPGSFELRVGQKYRIEIPAFQSASTLGIQEPDSYFTGNYITEVIKHEFSASGKYFASVQFFTDSVERKIK